VGKQYLQNTLNLELHRDIRGFVQPLRQIIKTENQGI
jgi:hypothetical protein